MVIGQDVLGVLFGFILIGTLFSVFACLYLLLRSGKDTSVGEIRVAKKKEDVPAWTWHEITYKIVEDPNPDDGGEEIPDENLPENVVRLKNGYSP